MSNQARKSVKSKPSLGVILPTLNDEQALPQVLQGLREAACLFELDVIVADGGSTDCTVDIAQRHDARVLEAEGGWQAQVAAGCRMLWGQWVMILGGNVVFRPGWSANLRLFVDATGEYEFAAHGRSQDQVRGPFGFLHAVPASHVGLVLRRSQLETLLQRKRPGTLTDANLIDQLDRKRLIQLPYILHAVADEQADAA